MKNSSNSLRETAAPVAGGIAEVFDELTVWGLSRVKAQWYFGEWERLATLSIDAVSANPDRGRIAILVASAHAQLGSNEEAQKWVRQARDWGCSPRMAAQALVSGVHNSLGRLAALRRDDKRMKFNFEAAMSVADAQDMSLASHARAVREMTKLGLLQQAAVLISGELETATSDYDRGRQQSRIDMLKTELELLQHELGLALKRGSNLLSPPPKTTEVPRIEQKDLASRSLAQLGQDLWVLERTGYKRGGFFVEFGATDGVSLNNTYLLETAFDWVGLCAEPNPVFFAKLCQNRRCRVSQECIGARTGEQEDFVFANAYGGFKKHVRSDQHADRREPYLNDPSYTARLRTISLNDFLIEHEAPRDIDYISVDTEGSEYEILSNFPFEQWNVRLWTVEHNFTPVRKEIQWLMGRHGYTVRESEWDDWFFRE